MRLSDIGLGQEIISTKHSIETQFLYAFAASPSNNWRVNYFRTLRAEQYNPHEPMIFSCPILFRNGTIKSRAFVEGMCLEVE